MAERQLPQPPWDPDEPTKHQTAGIHSHAYYTSADDLQARLDAASGYVAPVPPLPPIPPIGGPQQQGAP